MAEEVAAVLSHLRSLEAAKGERRSAKGKTAA